MKRLSGIAMAIAFVLVLYACVDRSQRQVQQRAGSAIV